MLKLKLLALALSVASFGAATADAQTQVARYKVNGAGAIAYVTDGAGGWCWLSVSQGAASQFLYYNCYSGSSSFGGWGVIPDSAFAGGKLNVDTSQVSGFSYYSGGPIVIALEWQKTNNYREGGSGTYRFDNGAISYHQAGTWTSTSATVNGSVDGAAMAGDGNLNRMNQVSISIEKNTP